MRTLALSLSGLWALLIAPTLCMGGLMPHPCERMQVCTDDRDCCPQDGEAPGQPCPDDPCSPALVRTRGTETDPASCDHPRLEQPVAAAFEPLIHPELSSANILRPHNSGPPVLKPARNLPMLC
jgi:hypothetical protein